MISLIELTKIFNTPHGPYTALRNINLKADKGTILGIVGKSGAGKSSLIRCINLLERPTSGEVIVDGQQLTRLSASELRQARRKIGMIFQHFNLLTSRNVYQNISLPLELIGMSSSEIKKIIHPLIELTGLKKKIHVYPSQLSGGQKQRVAIARALASQPKVLLSDEATSALDPETTSTILQLLKDIRDNLGVTILLITHEMGVVKNCCDRVGILHKGELIEENEIGEFFAHAKTEIAKKFVVSSLNLSLPKGLTSHFLDSPVTNSRPVWRLWFLGRSATEPVITHLIAKFNLQINILQANIEHINRHIMGIMVVTVDGSADDLTASLKYLEVHNVQTEILGHVPSNITSFI